jgi:hypothetical protein
MSFWGPNRLPVLSRCDFHYAPKHHNSTQCTGKQNARRLLEFPIERYASGHGPVREGGVAALHRAIADAS